MSTLLSQHVHSVTTWQGFNCTYTVFHLTLCVHHVSTKSRAPTRDSAQGYYSTHIQQSPKSFTNQFMNITMYSVTWSTSWVASGSHDLTHQSWPNSSVWHTVYRLYEYFTAVVMCCKHVVLLQELWFWYNVYFVCVHVLIVLVTLYVLHTDVCTATMYLIYI